MSTSSADANTAEVVALFDTMYVVSLFEAASQEESESLMPNDSYPQSYCVVAASGVSP